MPIGADPRVGRAPPSRALGWTAATLVAILAALPPLAGAHAGRGEIVPPTAFRSTSEGGPALPVAASGATPISLVPDGSASTLPTSFWGTTVPVDAGIPGNETELLQATPARWLVWPGGGFGDRYDALTGALYSRIGAYGSAPSNESQFVALCRATNCTAIVQVPGEIDDPALAASIVRFTEQNLNFVPAYWEVGNEPGLWQHYNQSWSAWSGPPSGAPTPDQYAEEVGAYAAAMRAVDPSVRIIGFPGGGQGAHDEVDWLSAVARIDGTAVDAYAIHVYPAGLGRAPHPSLSDFLTTLNGTNSLPTRVPVDRAAIAAACAACASDPLFVTELGSAVLSGPLDPYVEGFPDAVYLGAELVQAVELNVSNADYFAARFDNPGAWENGSGAVRPIYTLYADLLDRLGPTVQPLAAAGGVGGIYALETSRDAPGRATDLLVVNANATVAVQLPGAGLYGLPAGSIESWSWDASSSEPRATYLGDLLPRSFALPAASLLLVEVRPGGAWPVVVQESGLPTGARWFLNLSGQVAASGTSTMTYFLPNGSYAIAPVPPDYPAPGVRIEGPPATPVVVAGTPRSLSVRFQAACVVTTEASPASGGEVEPPTGWENASGEVRLNATAHPGFAFSGWTGTGVGAYSGPDPSAIVNVSVPLTETASFLPAFLVTVHLSGLPANTAIELTLDGVVRSLGTDFWAGYLANGTHGWSVTAPPGFSADPSSGELTVDGLPLNLTVRFDRVGSAVVGPTAASALISVGSLEVPALAMAALAAAVGLNVLRNRIDRSRGTGRRVGDRPTPSTPGSISESDRAPPGTISDALERDLRQRCWAATRQIEALPRDDPRVPELLAELPPVLRALGAGNARDAHERLGRLEQRLHLAADPTKTIESERTLWCQPE